MTLLDPQQLHENFKLFFSVDTSKYFGFDLFSGKPGGYSYAASTSSIFTLLDTFVRVGPNIDFLSEKISTENNNNFTVYDWILELSLTWQNFSQISPFLTDYGGNPNNFLECVPFYVHAVPFLNAANSWMMKISSSYALNYEKDTQKALMLEKFSNETAKSIIQNLYVNGSGFFGSLYPNGSLIHVRHILDFLSVSNYLQESFIPNETKSEMIEFLMNELVVPGWMRALSLKDVEIVKRPE